MKHPEQHVFFRACANPHSPWRRKMANIGPLLAVETSYKHHDHGYFAVLLKAALEHIRKTDLFTRVAQRCTRAV